MGLERSKITNKKVEEGQDYDDNWQGGWEELFPNDAVENFHGVLALIMESFGLKVGNY